MYLPQITTCLKFFFLTGKKWTLLKGGTFLLTLMLGNTPGEMAKIPEIANQVGKNILLLQTAAINNKYPRTCPEFKHDSQIFEEKMIVQDEEIPFGSEQRIDPDLPPGESRVVTEGTNGRKRNICLISIIGDQEVKREVVSSQVINPPVNKVIIFNPAHAVTAISRGQGAAQVAKAEFEVIATAYTFTGENTASGVPPRVGLVAVDPRVIPLGTRLYIDGYGYAVAADTGGAIKGRKVDLFFNTERECQAWGRKIVKIYILAQ